MLIWAMGLASLVASEPALAGCCRVVRVDPETASAQVQICEPDFEGHCGSVLFTGILAVGEAADVCSASDSVVYQEYDATLGGFAPEIGAMCEGGDVEI